MYGFIGKLHPGSRWYVIQHDVRIHSRSNCVIMGIQPGGIRLAVIRRYNQYTVNCLLACQNRRSCIIAAAAIPYLCAMLHAFDDMAKNGKLLVMRECRCFCRCPAYDEAVAPLLQKPVKDAVHRFVVHFVIPGKRCNQSNHQFFHSLSASQ